MVTKSAPKPQRSANDLSNSKLTLSEQNTRKLAAQNLNEALLNNAENSAVAPQHALSDLNNLNAESNQSPIATTSINPSSDTVADEQQSQVAVAAALAPDLEDLAQPPAATTTSTAAAIAKQSTTNSASVTTTTEYDRANRRPEPIVTTRTVIVSNNRQLSTPPQVNSESASGFNRGRRTIINLDHLAKPKPVEPESEIPTIAPAAAVLPAGLVKDSSLRRQQSRGHVSTVQNSSSKSEEEVIPTKSPKIALRKQVMSGGGNIRRLSASQLALLNSSSGNEIDEKIIQMHRPRSNFGKFKKNKANNKDMVQDKVIREVEIPQTITVQELASRMSIKATSVIKSLINLGVMATINQNVDADTAELIVTEFGHKFKRVNAEEEIMELIADSIDTPESMVKRAPVVTVMGHVDHGKTSLLDALRLTDVVRGESGGITQHIGAYNVTLKNGQSITFLDTPGHEAFTAMRMRGAKVTDIVILVVAANDGIKAQTVEAISHAKAAEVPIIVAINKMDHPNADFEKVKTSLFNYELIPEDMGGDVMVVGLSAHTKQGLDKLEEAVLLCAELLELRANPNKPGRGHVIEAKIDKQKGISTTFLIEKGTLRIGDIVVAGKSFGKVKDMVDDKGRHIKLAGPSSPVEVFGLNTVPTAGDEFAVTVDEKTAKQVATFREKQERDLLSAKHTICLDRLIKQNKGAMKELTIILKADVKGSLEAIVHSLIKLNNDEVSLRIVLQNVGGISESDITLAATSSSLVIGFNVRASAATRDLAKSLGVDIRYYSVIYDLINDVKNAMGGLLSPIMRENIIGYAEIRRVFEISSVGQIAGSYVTEGTLQRGCNIRLLRNNVIIHTGKIKSLRRDKDDVKEVRQGFECGIMLDIDILEKDMIEAYEIIEEKRSID